MSFEYTHFSSIREPLLPPSSSRLENSIEEMLAELSQEHSIWDLTRQFSNAPGAEQTPSGVPTHQLRLLQSDKMASLSQIVAGVAHEINNPASFIYGNLFHLRDAVANLFSLIQLYEESCPQPHPGIQAAAEAMDLDFLKEDLPKMLASMEVGANRIRQIVLSLRNFSRLGESHLKSVDLHEGLENTLVLLKNRLNSNRFETQIQIVSEYQNLPQVECYASQINQVFWALISRAIEGIEDAYAISDSSLTQEPPFPRWTVEKQVSRADPHQRSGKIRISTHQDGNCVWISISDNGLGILEKVRRYLLNPAMVRYPKRPSQELGLALAHQIIVEQHGGDLKCIVHGIQGSQFLVRLPISQSPSSSTHCGREMCSNCTHLRC